MNLRLDNGVLATYQQCHYTPDYWRNYTVIGTHGRLENFGDLDGATVKVWNARRSGYRADADITIDVPVDDDEPRRRRPGDRRRVPAVRPRRRPDPHLAGRGPGRGRGRVRRHRVAARRRRPGRRCRRWPPDIAALLRDRVVAMILTVTPNPALDITYHVARALRLGEVNRVDAVSERAGGKGLNVARHAGRARRAGARARAGRRRHRRDRRGAAGRGRRGARPDRDRRHHPADRRRRRHRDRRVARPWRAPAGSEIGATGLWEPGPVVSRAEWDRLRSSISGIARRRGRGRAVRIAAAGRAARAYAGAHRHGDGRRACR